MHVIRHDYITTDPDVEFLYPFERIFSKGLVRGLQAINFSSMGSTYRDEKKRRIIGLKICCSRGDRFLITERL